MSDSPVPIIATKLSPPMLTEQTVQRASLRARLGQVDHAALVAIVAPAGYGKTTAAAQLAGDAEHSVAWLSLETADNEPVRFWSYVASALCAGGVGSADTAYRLLADGPAQTNDAIAAMRAAVERHGNRVTLVLDDLHLITNSEIEHQLSELLRTPQPNLRLVCASRHDLDLPVGRLRSQGQLAEARVEDLAFAPHESRAFLRDAFGIRTVDDRQFDMVHQRTQGWPTGLYLAGLSLRGHPDVAEQIERFAGDTRHLSEYLASEVVDDLDDDTRAFVLTTSIVHTLEADLCDELTGKPGSLATLRGLVRDNVFTVALDQGITVFRYHPLLRDNLQSTLAEEHPELLPTLHSRASSWFERNGDIDRSIDHATASGDTLRARRLITESWLEFSSAGSFTAIERWVHQLGDEGRSDGTLCLSMAWSLLNLGRYAEVEEWLDAAAIAAADPIEAQLALIEGGTIRSHKARHLGDVGQLVAQAELAATHADYELLPELGEPPHRLTGASGASLAASTAAAYWSGDLASVNELAMATVSHARIIGEPSSVVIGYTYLALVAVDAGDSDAALAHADQALRLVHDAETERFHRPTAVHLARAMALRLQGRVADADAALDEAERVDALINEQLFRLAIHAERALVRHLMGDRAGARAALREAKAVAERVDARADDRLRAVENTIRFVPLDQPDLPPGARDLTAKEQAVLALLPHHLSRRELAAQLHVSENTIKTHLTSIRHKLGVPGRGDLVERASELGLIDDPPHGA